jgi:hypothetical protein
MVSSLTQILPTLYARYVRTAQLITARYNASLASPWAALRTQLLVPCTAFAAPSKPTASSRSRMPSVILTHAATVVTL